MTARLPSPAQHVAALRSGLDRFEHQLHDVEGWAAHLKDVLTGGGRLLVAGNGGSAAQAQHLTSELVGRFRDDRDPFSAIALTAETSSLTALVNDYGADEVFARQVGAHGRSGDVLLTLSTSGRSANVLAAAAAGRRRGLTTWALTGAGPNPLAAACDDAICVDAATTATVQEIHLIAIHVLCGAFDRALGVGGSAGLESVGS